MSILHVAPEPSLSQLLRAIPNVEYVGGDITRQYGPERIDVTNLEFADGRFDATVCNHVLEHVPEDTTAMREICRALKPGGWAILQVPDVWANQTDEDPNITAADARARFGQADHVRQYGWDYVDRLRAAGFEVQVSRGEGIFTPKMIERYRLRKFGEIEPIFFARRPIS